MCVSVCTCTRTGLHLQMQPALLCNGIVCVRAYMCVCMCVRMCVCVVCVCVWTMCVQGVHVLICGCI